MRKLRTLKLTQNLQWQSYFLFKSLRRGRRDDGLLKYVLGSFPPAVKTMAQFLDTCCCRRALCLRRLRTHLCRRAMCASVPLQRHQFARCCSPIAAWALSLPREASSPTPFTIRHPHAPDPAHRSP